jgi:hypothetical protein
MDQTAIDSRVQKGDRTPHVSRNAREYEEYKRGKTAEKTWECWGCHFTRKGVYTGERGGCQGEWRRGRAKSGPLFGPWTSVRHPVSSLALFGAFDL